MEMVLNTQKDCQVLLRWKVTFSLVLNFDLECYGSSFKDELRIIRDDLRIIQLKYKILI